VNNSQTLACSPYSRQQAAYPLPWLRERKFWPAVSRVDDGELAIAGHRGCHAYGFLSLRRYQPHCEYSNQLSLYSFDLIFLSGFSVIVRPWKRAPMTKLNFILVAAPRLFNKDLETIDIRLI